MVQRLLVEQGVDIARELYLGMRRRPRRRPRRRDGVDGGRHGDRRGRRQAPREDPEGGGRPGGRPAPAARRASSPTASACTARPPRTRPSCSCTRSTRAFVEHRLLAARDQPAGRAPRTASVLALDAKINFDDNALYRHPELEALRDLDEEDPAETEAKKYDLVVHQARRQHRLHGQRRRPGDGDDGHHQALRRPAGELPRRRRRRHRGEGHRGVQDHHRRSRR